MPPAPPGMVVVSVRTRQARSIMVVAEIILLWVLLTVLVTFSVMPLSGLAETQFYDNFHEIPETTLFPVTYGEE